MFLFLFSPVESATTARLREILDVRCFVLVFRNEIKKGRGNGEIQSLKTRTSGTAISRNQKGNQKGNQSGIKGQ